MSEAPSTSAVLRRLFWTLLLRGRVLRNMGGAKAGGSIFRKFGMLMALYLLVGCMAMGMMGPSIFALSLVLHAMSFVFAGMMLAGSSGEILFNREEAEILLHRPVPPEALLWAKVRVMAELALCLVAAFNAAALIGGLFLLPHGLRFLLAHAASTILMALFTVGCIVLAYQLCLKWAGRERLESLLTASQVLMGILAVLMGQLPRLFTSSGHAFTGTLTGRKAWLCLFPPAWFAGFDECLAGNPGLVWGLLAAVALVATGLVLYLALGRLAGVYQAGLQDMGESAGKAPRTASSFGSRLADLPPFSWWLRHPVTRATFVLTLTYVVRDRDAKLRFYPGLAPFLVFPLIMLVQARSSGGAAGFMVPMTAVFLAMTPLSALEVLTYSQQWEAAAIFRMAPLAGPGPVCDGVRRAVLTLLAVPVFILMAIMLLGVPHASAQGGTLLAGLLAMPVIARLPSRRGWAIPFSQPIEASASAARVLYAFAGMIVAGVVAGLAAFAQHFGWLGPFLGAEALVLGGLYFMLRRALDRATWTLEGEAR